jgi:DNA-binding XRE family transcriptional regulator
MKKGFSNVIGAKLKEMGKTQSWLAEKAGVAQSTINDLVKQKRTNPGFQTVVKILRAMGCVFEELFFPAE